MTQLLVSILLSMFLMPSEVSAFLQLTQRRHPQVKTAEPTSHDLQSTDSADKQTDAVEEQNETCKTASLAPELETNCCKEAEQKWYFEVKPAYYYLTDNAMRQHFNTGGFTGRVEIGYKAWRSLFVWLDGGYFQKDGKAIGGPETITFKLATITLGLKGIYFLHDQIAVYAGAGPRVFMMMMHNSSPFVRGDDNVIGVGGGFDAGFQIFPFPKCKNIFFDLFADYSLKKLNVGEDEISSLDSDIDVSGLTAGIGLGIRF